MRLQSSLSLSERCAAACGLTQVAIASDTSFYILKYNREMVDAYLASGEPVDENEGIEDAFELLYEIGERVRTAVWMGDCFIYNNSEWRLNYCVGGEITTIFHLDRWVPPLSPQGDSRADAHTLPREGSVGSTCAAGYSTCSEAAPLTNTAMCVCRPMYILGYMASQNRLYLIDREFSIISYTLLMSAIEFKTLVLREEVEAAFELLPDIPTDMHSGLARFLESRGLIKEALQVRGGRGTPRVFVFTSYTWCVCVTQRSLRQLHLLTCVHCTRWRRSRTTSSSSPSSWVSSPWRCRLRARRPRRPSGSR